jgi:CRISPR-associated protein Cmr3
MPVSDDRPVAWLAFAPRDTVLVRDGRSFNAGADAIAETVYPWPSTIAGVVGKSYGAEPDEVRGPVLARSAAAGWHPHFPVPADLGRMEQDPDRICRLRPRPAGQAITDLPGELEWMFPPDNAGRTDPLTGWLRSDTLEHYLRGKLTIGRHGLPVSELRLVKEPLVPERRVGLARTAGRTAMSGYLYQMTHLRFHGDWALLAECTLKTGWTRTPVSPVQMGGRGRQADVTTVDGVEWPQPPDTFPGGNVLVYVATPAIWPGGWRLPVPPGARLVAAAVGAPQPVAMATPERVFTTRTLRWAVPAGSVYLLRFGDGGDQGEREAKRWAEANHGKACGLPDKNRIRTAGFGVVLAGVWS